MRPVPALQSGDRERTALPDKGMALSERGIEALARPMEQRTRRKAAWVSRFPNKVHESLSIYSGQARWPSIQTRAKARKSFNQPRLVFFFFFAIPAYCD